MALETPKTKSEIKGNITSLETRIENQEKLIKSYEAIVNNLNSKITAFQRYVNIEKILKVETDRNKITELNIEKTGLKDKYPVLSGKNQAAVESEIVALETQKKDRQKDLDEEIATLEEDKLNLRDHKAIDNKRPWASLSKSSVGKIVGYAGIAALTAFTTSKILNVTKGNKDSDKNKTEETAPKTDTTANKGKKDSTYVMPTPATPKKDTVYVPTPVKDKDSDKVKVDKEKERELKDLKKKNKDLADRLKNVDQKKNFPHFNPKSLGSYNENGRYKVKFNGEIYSYDSIDDAGKVQKAEKERVQ